jgi:hypothetical protein
MCMMSSPSRVTHSSFSTTLLVSRQGRSRTSRSTLFPSGEGKSERSKGSNPCDMVRFAYPSFIWRNRQCVQVLFHSGRISPVIGIGTEVLQ